jgi:hypothetical protein
MHKQPNLFQWATSELSQDAFLCWLIDWSHPVFKGVNTLLTYSSKAFIDLLTENKIESIEKLEIKKQYKNIDIVVLINDKHIILIEDKVNSKEHGEQLPRYKSLLKLEYPSHEIHPVYLKTGDQSNYRNAKENGYKVVNRSTLLKILKEGVSSGIQNNIYIDFKNTLESIETVVQSYLLSPIEEWNLHFWAPWKGFYQHLQNELNDGNWDYVPQKNGGFLGYWWNFKSGRIEDIEFEYYLQLEHNKLCFKIHVDGSNDDKYKVQNRFRQKLFKLAKEHEIDIRKNGRIGKTMTVAALCDNYIITNQTGVVDMPATIKNLRKINNLIDTLDFE